MIAPPDPWRSLATSDKTLLKTLFPDSPDGIFGNWKGEGHPASLPPPS